MEIVKKKRTFILITTVAGAVLFAAVIVGLLLFKHYIGRGSDASEPVQYKNQHKIDEEVWEMEPDGDGKRLVYVFREGVPREEFEAAFYEKYGFETSDYEDGETYRTKTVPRLTKKIEEKYGKENAASISLGFELYGDEISPLDYELLEDYDNYIINSRAVREELYLKHNDDFFKRNSIDRESVLVNSLLTGSIIMYADEKLIRKMAEDASVLDITAYEIFAVTNDD